MGNNKFTMAVIAVISFIFICAWQNIQATQLGYKIEKLNQEIKDLETSNKYMQKELDIKLAQSSLEKRAMEMGMIYPEPSAVITLDTAASAGNSGAVKNWVASADGK